MNWRSAVTMVTHVARHGTMRWSAWVGIVLSAVGPGLSPAGASAQEPSPAAALCTANLTERSTDPEDEAPRRTLLERWQQQREAFARAGVAISLSQVVDGSALHADDRLHGVARGLLHVSLDLDLEALVGVTGGSLLFQSQFVAGGNGSVLLGDAQGFSNIDAAPTAGLGELWYHQEAGERLRLRIGRLDVARDFAATEHGAGFLNSSMGLIPTLTGAPKYPEPAPGAALLFDAGRHVAIGAAAYAPNLRSRPSFGIAELALRWARAPGRLAVGSWRHEPRDRPGERGRGWYALLDQAVWKASPTAGVDLFAQYGAATAPDVAAHLAAGLVARQLVTAARSDEGGIAVTWLETGAGEASDAEWALEGYWGVQVIEAARAQLDVQRIRRRTDSEAVLLAVTLRLIVGL